MKMVIREINVEDAEQLTSLIHQVEAESDYMMMEAGERQSTPEKQRQRIQSMEKSENSTILVAEDDGKLVGYMFVIGGTARRTRHSAYLVVGILAEYRGQGVGTKLFEKLDVWAAQQQIHRLELTVVTRNKAALALYKKMGFAVEGTKRDSLLINGEYADEFYMAKLV
jgi:RimJ/RimL family protein N-acetyltransferase